ncbi:hypothetical protein GARC_1701 [Paraglaciecola arctica BSs20135]|uniref:Uncharacterized protein n=1 Tax=Paraglaciecola arctica BSs20135 TaxID=493475 RepID=K6YPV4_9ALTE|nr:hypothetical protein GARC_1701 [Paraglaciecola arctica BSs20135]
MGLYINNLVLLLYDYFLIYIFNLSIIIAKHLFFMMCAIFSGLFCMQFILLALAFIF